MAFLKTKKINYLRFFKKLEEKTKVYDLKIIPARNYYLLPHKNVGRDVDIVVARSKLKIWEKILIEIANDLNYDLISGARYKYCYQYFYKIDDFNSLEIDLLPSFHWRGIDWLDEQKVINESMIHKRMIFCPRSDHEFLITFNHSYLHGGFFPKKYKKILKNLYFDNPEKINTLFNIIYGKNDTKKIIKLFLEDNYSELNKINSITRIKCLIRYFFRSPFKFIYGFISSYGYDIWLRFSKNKSKLN